MLLVAHIIFSLGTIMVSILGKTKATIVLLAGSFTSGFALVFLSPNSLGRFCLSGLVLTMISLLLLRVHQLVKQPTR